MLVFFFQAEDGIRDLVRSRGLGDVYKRQGLMPGESVRRTRAGHFIQEEEPDEIARAVRQVYENCTVLP